MTHGFGTRHAPLPQPLLRPHQVHGRAVAVPSHDAAGLRPVEADAVVSCAAVAVAVVTADCVPVLACAEDGAAVAAIHAGWRGLAAGVVEAGVDVLRGHATRGVRLVAAVGPHIGACCYEVDAPVLEALHARFGGALEAALAPTRPGHARLDLGALVRLDLQRSGIDAGACGAVPSACTRCDAERFHSHRRDGARAGRLVHYVAARAQG